MAVRIDILVALAMDYAFDRDAFIGIAKCAHEYGDIFISPKYAMRSFVDEVAEGKPRGLIVSTSDPKVVDEVVSLRIPCVNIANCVERHADLPVVGTDDAAIARMVAEHYVERGFRHFAYFADPSVEYFHPRRDGFVSALKGMGFACHVSPTPPPPPRIGGKRAGSAKTWAVAWKDAGSWLATLPLPLAVMCPFDRYAREMIDLCQSIGLSVPEQVSVIGVDNDQLLCLSIWPATSSVVTPAAKIGYRAMQLLRNMIDGQPAPAKPILLPPVEIALRGSSSELAISDPDVAAAVQFIRSHLRQDLTVARIADHTALSRRTLERRFLETLNRSPLDEIRRARIANAKRLLIETDLTLPDIARRSGLIRQQRLSNLIKAETGLTPTEFRAHYAR